MDTDRDGNEIRTRLGGVTTSAIRTRLGGATAPATRVAALLGIFLAATLAHRESLSYWFTSADTIPLIASAQTESLADLDGVFTEPLMAGTRFEEVGLFYRPLSTLSFALDYALWGLDPAGYHLTNLLLHGGTAVLAAVALVAVTGRRGAGYLGGLLFAIHPLTAEVVPTAGRRQDVLMTFFLLGALVLLVRASRSLREGTPRCPRGDRSAFAGSVGCSAFAGSVGCYGLALLAKEPALVFPGMVAAWIALEYGRARAGPDGSVLRNALTPAAARAAALAVVPYAVVTGIYLAVRISVLGEVGGYQEQDTVEVDDRLLVGIEYLLSLGYQQDPIGFATLSGTPGAWWLVVLAMVAAAGVAVGGFVLGIRSDSQAGREPRGRLVRMNALPFSNTLSLRGLRALAFVGLLVAVPLAIRLESTVYEHTPLLYAEGSIAFAYPRPSSAVVGLLLVGAFLVAVAWALRAREGRLHPTDRVALLFLPIWLAGPLALFVITGDYALRSGYFSVVPATGALAVVLSVGIEGLRERFGGRSLGTAGPSFVLVGIVLLLVVPLVATSPLVHPTDGWETSGEINEEVLTGVEEATANGPPDADLRVEGLVINVADRGCEFPREKSVLYARPGTVEAWLDLHDREHDLTTADAQPLEERPAEVTAHTAVEGDGEGTDRAVVRMEYSGSVSGECATEAWDRVS